MDKNIEDQFKQLISEQLYSTYQSNSLRISQVLEVVSLSDTAFKSLIEPDASLITFTREPNDNWLTCHIYMLSTWLMEHRIRPLLGFSINEKNNVIKVNSGEVL